MKTINVKSGALDPVAMVKAEVDRGEGEMEVLLNNPIPASQIMRFLESKGYCVQLKDDDGAITISARKGEQPQKTATFKQQPVGRTGQPHDQPAPRPTAAAVPAPGSSGTFSVLITRCTLGSDSELGEALMKSFIGSLPQMEHRPIAVALMNEGVKLAFYDSSPCDHLKELENKGVAVLICDTCANYFNLMDQLGSGSISNILEIMETLNKADKILTL